VTTTTTTTYDKDGNPTGTSKTTTVDTTKPGDAWVFKNGKWVKPAAPKGVPTAQLAWNDDKGWVTKSQQADEYSYSMAVINSDPTGSLAKVFNEAWAAEKSGSAWTQEKFNIKITSTAWYKARSKAQREYDAMAADPRQNVDLATRTATQLSLVTRLAQQQGVVFSNTELSKIAKDSLRNGSSTDDINKIFANVIKTRKGGLKGFFDNISGATGVGADKTDILDWAKKNGVTVTNDWVTGQIDQILAGAHDVQRSKDYITKLAKDSFPAHADKIDAKSSVMDLAQNYIQKIASMLELNIGDVDLSNQHLQNALKPAEDGKSKNFTQVEQEIRGSADWAKTNNAKETTNSVINNILNKFGLM